MDAYEAVITKRDTREYADEPVPAESLERVLRAARMAGSGKNRQAGRIVVVTDPATQAALGRCGEWAGWIDAAPVVLAMAIHVDAGLRPHFDIGRMAQNAMIVARSEGLATCPVTISDQAGACRALGMPDDFECPIAVTVGVPAAPDGQRRSQPRRPLSEIVHHERWST